MDKDYCKGCNFYDKRYPKNSVERLPFCRIANTFVRLLKNCPMKSDDYFK